MNEVATYAMLPLIVFDLSHSECALIVLQRFKPNKLVAIWHVNLMPNVKNGNIIKSSNHIIFSLHNGVYADSFIHSIHQSIVLHYIINKCYQQLVAMVKHLQLIHLIHYRLYLSSHYNNWVLVRVLRYAHSLLQHTQSCVSSNISI
jgi:hypothetical protein